VRTVLKMVLYCAILICIVDTIMKDSITRAEYRAFQQAYDFFNKELFTDSLPPVLVTLQRHAKAYGYFSPERFVGRSSEEQAHELAMNPDHFGRTDEKILSTLAHEMVHVWQQAHGTPSRRGYHNRQWAVKMKEIGLQASTTGAPGGKETGQRVSHYIVLNGPYAKAYARLEVTGFSLRWQSRIDDPSARKTKNASMTKFTCPKCGQNAWAKPDTVLICGLCFDDGGDVCHLLAKDSSEH
jgi:hypothetical protein